MKSRVNSLRKRTIIIHFPGHHIGHPTFQGSDSLCDSHPPVLPAVIHIDSFQES